MPLSDTPGAGFHRLKIAEVIDETAEARSIRFEVPPELREIFSFRPGQHLTLRATLDGEEVRRNYSMCTAPQDGQLKITIKRIAGGLFSNWANDTLAPGDEIDVMAPHGSFTWDFLPKAMNHYLAFAGGSGITPIMSLLQTALLVEPESRFTLVYGNRDSPSVIFLEALAQAKNRYIERLEVHHFLAEETGDIELFNGILDRSKCEEVLTSLAPPEDMKAFFICGPEPMMVAAEEALLDRKVPRERIHLERFTGGRPSAEVAAHLASLQEEAGGRTLTVTLSGRTRRIAFDAGAGTILESARLAGLPAPFACKAGVCATCRAKLVSGEVEMAARYGLTDEEIGAGYILTCQSIPKGEGVGVDYDA